MGWEYLGVFPRVHQKLPQLFKALQIVSEDFMELQQSLGYLEDSREVPRYFNLFQWASGDSRGLQMVQEVS